MLQILLMVTSGYLLYSIYKLVQGIRIARSSGLPYIVLPFNEYGYSWMFLGPYIYPILASLPYFPRLRWLQPEWEWHRKYECFQEMKSDIFITVCPSQSLVWVCDADIVHDMISRREDFPKPTHWYGVLEIFGKNVVTTGGQEWRAHRRVTSPQFNEKNNKLVWQEAVSKSDVMVSSWATPLPGQSRGRVVKSLMDDCMRLTLHIISRAGFGRKLQWPDRISTASNDLESPATDEAIPPGHTMSFQTSLHYLLENIYVILCFPEWYLKYTPLKSHRKTREAYREWNQYMKEMVQEKRHEIENGTGTRGDLMGALIRANDGGAKSFKGEPALTEAEVIGNTFIIILAGHETTANTLHFILMMLAIYPEYQIKLQEEIDQILRDREPDYERDYQALAEGWAGAIFHETLRLYPPVPSIPKWCPKPQHITVEGKRHVIPQGLHIQLNATNAHRNPKYWVRPHQTEEEAALNEFRPQRWFADSHTQSPEPDDLGDNEDGLAPQGKDTSGSFFRPHKGSYFPFSEGSRACLGRKFANVELVATLAVIFRRWSVELDVREGETVEDARRRACHYVQDLRVLLTLKAKGPEPGFRCVKRGEERYFPKRE